MLTVGDLVEELAKYPSHYHVHLDVADSNDDRIVVEVAGVRVQSGYSAIALDGGKLV